MSLRGCLSLNFGPPDNKYVADGDLWPILANGIKEGLVEITEAALREIIQ